LVVAKLIKDNLKLIHGVGVLQGDVKNLENIWLCGNAERGGDMRVVWRDFSCAVMGEKVDVVFCGRLKRELGWWRRQVKLLGPP